MVQWKAAVGRAGESWLYLGLGRHDIPLGAAGRDFAEALPYYMIDGKEILA